MPEDRVREAFDILVLEKPSATDVTPIIRYFRNTWLDGRHYTISHWNNYSNDGPRINNHVEAYNSTLNMFLTSKTKYMIIRWLRYIQTEENITSVEMAKATIKVGI